MLTGVFPKVSYCEKQWEGRVGWAVNELMFGNVWNAKWGCSMVSHSSCGCSCGASRAIRIRITSESLYGNLRNKDVCLMYWGVRVILRHHVYVRSSRNHAANLPLNTLPIQRRIVACARINATLPFCFWLFQAVDVWFFNHRLNITLCMY